MNLKACTFERLAFISLGFGRGAQIGKTSRLEVKFIYGASIDVGRIQFFDLVRFRPWDPAQALALLEEDAAFFFNNAKRR